MKIDLAQEILMLNGEPIQFENATLTLKEVCIQAVMIHNGNCETCMRTSKPLSNEDCIILWELAAKINQSDECEISEKEVLLVKERLAARWAHVGVVAQAYKMLTSSLPASQS